MLCENCQQAKASIHSLELEGEEWVQRHLCEKCALGAGPLSPDEGGKVLQFFGQLLAKAGEAGDSVEATAERCPGCGMTHEQFQNNRRLGCARCYEVYGGELEQIFKRVQESTTHTGKVPGRPSVAPPSSLELRRLRERLQRAVEEERFEEAALFRDQIMRLENGSDGD